ncbi:hypothetical protein FB45DRAFT_414066 [Roridomyces roridus]|uniref:Uncharacterized protein n=1 Tax=Roridomyces roridus TaxID=1738132 RepID=A0AAD7FTV3_9AGAR|nr:hypothetical protein FB45DRAFT_414066 [Roridomyces roridus]
MFGRACRLSGRRRTDAGVTSRYTDLARQCLICALFYSWTTFWPAQTPAFGGAIAMSESPPPAYSTEYKPNTAPDAAVGAKNAQQLRGPRPLPRLPGQAPSVAPLRLHKKSQSTMERPWKPPLDEGPSSKPVGTDPQRAPPQFRHHAPSHSVSHKYAGPSPPVPPSHPPPPARSPAMDPTLFYNAAVAPYAMQPPNRTPTNPYAYGLAFFPSCS